MADSQKIQTNGLGKRREILAMIQKWLTRFAAAYNYVPSEVVALVWLDSLGHLELGQLEPLFRRVEQTFKPTSACPFPAPVHLMELLSAASEAQSVKLAEHAWETALRAARFYTPDLPHGGLKDVNFDSNVWHCIRAAGGIAVIATCPLDDLHFRKADFVAAWENYTALEADVNFLPESQAKKLIAELGVRQKALE